MDLSVFFNNNKYKIAFGLFVAYLCLTMYKIGNNSLWYDECFSLDLGQDTVKEIINYSIYNDTNPPVYLLVVHFWIKLFGDSEVALRSISALSGSLACGLFFLMALRHFNWQTAVFCMLLFFTSNELYYYSQEGRTYGIILLLTVISNFIFVWLIKKPNLFNAVLLGLVNIIVFYTHTIACVNFVGQVILAIIVGFELDLFKRKNPQVLSFLGYKVKFIGWYFVSWLVFFICFWPWQERFFGIIKDGAKGFWLQKPTIVEYKQVLFDLYNSEAIFYTYMAVTGIIVILLIFFKKFRDTAINYKLILIPLILGPFLYNFIYFAASITPVFLKRYILFSFLGFILLFAYLLSSLKIDFRIKLAVIVALCIFSLTKMKIPRDEYWDYNDGVKYLETKMSPTTYIATDNSALFAYYHDRGNAFQCYQKEREAILAKSNVFQIQGKDWPLTTDFSSYSDIYYVRSFEDYDDPERRTRTALGNKFTLVENSELPGIRISHYKNVMPQVQIPREKIDEIKKMIPANELWYNQIVEKAKNSNISLDSMLTLDAIWYYKTEVLGK